MTAFGVGADPTDVMGRRVGAYVIDTLLALIIVMAIALPAFLSAADEVNTGGRSSFCTSYNDHHSGGFCLATGDTAYVLTGPERAGLGRIFYGATIGWTLLNAIVLQGLTGGTVGKLLLGLRVVRADGQRAGIGWCALRTVLLLSVDALCFVIGLVVALSSVGHRRVGDMAASTFVVPKTYVGQPVGTLGPGPWTSGSVGFGAPPPFGEGIGRSSPSGDGPTWDPARNAYIQYDRDRSAWLQWDDTASAWKPIERA